MSARNEHELYADYAQRGVKAAQNRDEAMLLAKLLRQEPAYSDPRHPNSAIIKRNLRELYEGFVPNEPAPNLMHVDGRAISGPADPQISRAPGTPADRLIARYNQGESLSAFSGVDRVALRRMLIAAPEYNDRSHPQHAAFVEDAKRLYELDAPKGDAQ